MRPAPPPPPLAPAEPPPPPATPFMVRISESAVYESKPLVGSSSTSTDGSVTSSMAIVTLRGGQVRGGAGKR